LAVDIACAGTISAASVISVVTLNQTLFVGAYAALAAVAVGTIFRSALVDGVIADGVCGAVEMILARSLEHPKENRLSQVEEKECNDNEALHEYIIDFSSMLPILIYKVNCKLTVGSLHYNVFSIVTCSYCDIN
jgi:hypothetical protein